MKKLLVVTLLFASAIVYGQEKAKWYVNFDKAAAVSMQTGKPIVANFTGSDWCGWCKKLKREVFDAKGFKDWADENVVLLELDYPRRTPQDEKIKIQNRELQQFFKVRGYPTIHVFSVAIKDGQTQITQHGQTGYVAGGPTPWINKTNSILNNKK
mgnify:CR=1 FL=1